MIQRPKYNEIGLTEADNKVLISELTKYAEEGASDEELKAFRDTFISEKKKSTPKSGTQPQSTSTTKVEKSVSAPTSGSSVTPKPKIKDEREEVVTQADEVSIGKPRKITTDPTKLKREDEAYKQLVNKKVAEYRQSTKVPVEDRQAIEEDLKAKKEKQGFLNGIQTGLKQGWNKFVDVIGAGGSEETKANWKAEIDPFADERKEAVEFFKEQKVKPTPAQIEQKTDEIYVKNKTLQVKQDRINDYLGSIDEQEKTYLEVDAQKRFPTISKKRQEILERISMNEKALAKSIADLKNPMTDEDRALVEDEITKITKYLDEDNALFSKATDELGTAQEEFDAFRRNYNWVENAKARITSSLVEGGLSFLEGLDYLGTLGGNLGDQKQSEQLFKDSEKARQGISEFREQFRPENKELTLDNFFQYSTDLLANQSGTLLTIAGAGETGGASILGLGQAGQTYAEMRKANKNGANYAPWQMVLAPAVSGTSTGILSASPTFETLKNAKNVWKSALKDPLAKSAVENAIKKTSSSITKQVIGDTRKEVTTELLDNTIQNAVKRDILGDKSVGYFDNSWQVLKDTALMTGLLNAGALPQVTMEGVKMFSKPENNKVLDANGQKIAQLLPQLDNENISEVSRKAIESEIDKATAENTQIINSTLDKIAKLPNSDVKKVVENNKKQGELISEAEAIKEDNSIEIPSKKILLDAKKQEYQKVQESTNEIINAETKSPTPESEVKPETEVQKPTEVEKEIVDEKQAKGNLTTDGNIRPTTEQVGEMATEQSPKTEVTETEVVESAVEPKPSEGVATEYLADMVPVIRFNPSGENEMLTGEDAISAENEIEEIVSSAISPKQAIAEANKRGLIFRNGAEKESFRQFVSDRIEGRTNESFANWRKDTNKKQVETKPTRKETRKKAVEVKIDEIANSVKNLESVFGIKIKAQGDDINIQGTSREQLIDFIAKTAKEIAKTGIEIDEAIRTVIDEIKKSFDTDIEVDEVRGLVEENPEPKRTFEREEGKKSLLSRMAEGDNSKSVQEAIEKYELNYEVENQEVAKKNAEAFVKEVGFDKAFTAIKENKITGAEKAFVYNRLLEIVNDKMESEGLQASEETISEYKELYGFITNEFDKESREAGRFISALNNVYNSSMLMYNLSNQIERHKAMGDGTIDEETLAMFKEADENIKRLEKQIKEAEKRANEAEEQLAIRNIEEDIARKKKGAPKTKSQQAKEIANKIRKAKIHKPGIFSSATPGSLAWDGAVEVIAKTIESGGTVADAINKGIEYIRKSKWYQSLADEQKSEAERELRGYIRETTKQPFVSISEDGKIKIPEKIIRDYVEQGVTDINDLSKKILDDIKEEYPEVTERQVRDAITRYGKTVNPSQDEIDAQIRKMKRIGKLVSGLEDAYSGKRPLRSGLQRDILTPEERKMQRELKELLRDIPMDESDLQKTWKTALDAIKTRLNNQITDLENQIANREKRKPEKTPIEYDQEAKDLRAKVESLKEALDEIVGKPELTEEQKIQKAVAGLEKSIESLTEQITNKQLEFKKKPSPIVSDEITRLREQQKALRNEILQMRKDAGIVEKRRLELAKLRTQNQITDLQRRIAEKDYTKKEISKIIPDDELTKLKAEKLKWQEVYDKDKYKQELKNRTINQRVIDGLFGVWNLPRVVMATGEMSWILIQGGVQSMSILTRNPAQFVENLRRMVVAMGSADKANEWERKVKATEIYQIAKDSKLALTEVDHQLDVREEQFLGDYASAIWDLNGLIAEQFLGKKERPLIGDKIKQLFVGKKEYAKTASAREQIKNVNPLRVLERGNTSYMNQLRLNRFIEGVEKLKLEGKDPVKDIEDYKALAKAINTLTGRANVPQFLKTTDPKVLAAIFFSFRNWVSKLNMLNPVFYYSLGNYSKPSEILTKKPTVAQKIAITDMMRYITITTSMMYLIQAAAGKDDEGEDVISIETDPRSSDYMKMRMGDLRLDPWGGLQSTITFFIRMATDQTKSTKTGEILTGGERFGARTRGELFQDYVSGKFNPSAGLIWECMHTKQKTDENGETYRENKFGEKFSIAEDVYNIKPMYWEAISEIKKEQPGVWGNFIIAAGALGINTQVYGKPKEGETSGPPKLPSMPSLPKLPKMP